MRDLALLCNSDGLLEVVDQILPICLKVEPESHKIQGLGVNSELTGNKRSPRTRGGT